MGDTVRFDAGGAAQMLALLARLVAGEDVPQADVEAVLETPAYRLFFAHHNRFAGRSLGADEFAAMLRAIPGGESDTANPQLERMWARIRKALGEEAVLACLGEPRRALALYNQAAEQLPGAYRFADELAQALAES